MRKKIFLVKSFLRFFLLYSFQGTAPFSRLPDFRIRVGGDEENRTPDPLLARQVLSQLSYAPIRPLSSCRLESSDLSRFDKVLRMSLLHVRLMRSSG